MPNDATLLLSREHAPTPATPIDAERLRAVLDRLASGFYDRPDVRELIAQRLAPDLR